MINITRLNGPPFTLNADLIESVEEIPDTVITLTTGKKFFVTESRETVKTLVISYKQSLYSNQVGFFSKDSDRQ